MFIKLKFAWQNHLKRKKKKKVAKNILNLYFGVPIYYFFVYRNGKVY